MIIEGVYTNFPKTRKSNNLKITDIKESIF